MDMSFAGQALSAEYLTRESRELPARVILVPEAIDKEVAKRRLQAFDKRIDKLTLAQKNYLRSWHD